MIKLTTEARRSLNKIFQAEAEIRVVYAQGRISKAGEMLNRVYDEQIRELTDYANSLKNDMTQEGQRDYFNSKLALDEATRVLKNLSGELSLKINNAIKILGGK